MQKTLDLEVKCCLKCPPWICTNTDYAFPRSRDYCLRIKGKIYWKGIIQVGLYTVNVSINKNMYVYCKYIYKYICKFICIL